MADVTISSLSPLTPSTGLVLPVSNGSTTGSVTLSQVCGVMTSAQITTALGYTPLSTPSYTSYRYWRYVSLGPVKDHHPMLSRIILSTNIIDTTIFTQTTDNCNDIGTFPGNGTTYSYDFSTPTLIKSAKIYSTFGLGTRAANYAVQYSSDNTNWTTFFGGIMFASGCGIVTGTGGLL